MLAASCMCCRLNFLTSNDDVGGLMIKIKYHHGVRTQIDDDHILFKDNSIQSFSCKM